MKENPYLKMGLSIVATTFIVLLVIGGSVGAEITGRAALRRDLEDSQRHIHRLEVELASLRQFTVQQLADANKREADRQAKISELIADAKLAFRDTSWLKNWITSSGRK